jgi:hypothetical protein
MVAAVTVLRIAVSPLCLDILKLIMSNHAKVSAKNMFTPAVLVFSSDLFLVVIDFKIVACSKNSI